MSPTALKYPLPHLEGMVMPTLTGKNIRTLTGYVVTLLEYPRWILERDIDFTHCHLHGAFDSKDKLCATCPFGTACHWLDVNRTVPSRDAPLDELLRALSAAVEYLRSATRREPKHDRCCNCDTCLWLREATGFLRTRRRRA